MHLNPVRAGLLGPKDRLLEYAWSRLAWYLAGPQHRPVWMRVDRLLGEHGIQKDNAAGREQFEQRRERRRAEENKDAAWKPRERGGCLGSGALRAKVLERRETQLGEHHAGGLKFETRAAKAQRLVAEELKRLKWREQDLNQKPKGDADKVAIAARRRKETTLTVAQIAHRLHLGSLKSLRNKLYLRSKAAAKSKAIGQRYSLTPFTKLGICSGWLRSIAPVFATVFAFSAFAAIAFILP